MNTVLVTGAAGFIGMHCAQRLLAQGLAVVGIDNLNSYYDVALKDARLAQLQSHPHFRFVKLDVADRERRREREHLLMGRCPVDFNPVRVPAAASAGRAGRRRHRQRRPMYPVELPRANQPSGADNGASCGWY